MPSILISLTILFKTMKLFITFLTHLVYNRVQAPQTEDSPPTHSSTPYVSLSGPPLFLLLAQGGLLGLVLGLPLVVEVDLVIQSLLAVLDLLLLLRMLPLQAVETGVQL